MPADDPETPGKEGGVNGETVEFYVAGVKAAENATFSIGGVTKLNLTLVDNTAPTVTLPAYTPDPTNNNTPTYSGTATDALTNVVDIEYRVGNGTWTDVDAFTPALSVSFTFTTPALAGGTHTIYVKAKDDAGNWSTPVSDTLTVTAVSPDFSIGVSPTSGSVAQGGSTTATVSILSIAGFTSTVSLSASGLPSGATASFNPSSGAPSFTSTLTISTASTTPAGTYTVTITGTGGEKTHTTTYTLTVLLLPTPEEIENMTPEDVAEILAALDPEIAADILEDITPEHAGRIIDTAVEAGLIREFADILRWMTPSSAASALLNANPANAARVLEWIVQNYPEIAAEIADAGAKENLGGMASILNEMDSGSVATLLMGVFDLPETPKIAADLLGAISLDKSIAVVRILLNRGMYAYVNGMFAHLTDERLNDIWEGLTQQQRDTLLPYLSSEVKDRITALKPSPWVLVAGIITAIVIVIVIVALLYKRRPKFSSR